MPIETGNVGLQFLSTIQDTERLKSCDSLKLQSLQRFLSRGEVPFVNWVWCGFVWNLVSKQQVCGPWLSILFIAST